MTPAPNEYEPVIGLEVHAQLLTKSKMFCGCDSHYSGAEPNTHVCPVDLGFPGTLPVVNSAAVDKAIMVALALNCQVSPVTKFDRKNYPYPDIPKGYQISQYDTPLGHDGHIEIEVDGQTQRVGIIRAHLEEDTGKTIHGSVDGQDVSLVDYNRSGIPLLEIVSEPDLRSSRAAREYFATLRQILVYLGVSSGDMQEGALRADVNVSVRRPGGELGVKVEIKNLNSFRSVARALDYEIARQVEALSRGESLSQETRGWDEAKGKTVSQRSKEHAEDYRYFPEPDLPPLAISTDRVAHIRGQMPELPAARRSRFVSAYGLPDADSRILTADLGLAQVLDETMALAPEVDPKLAANWLTGEFLRLLNATGTSPSASRITTEDLAEFLRLLGSETISNAIGKTLFEEMFATGAQPSAIIERLGLARIDDRSQLMHIVRQVLDANPALVRDYINKDRKTEGPLVGKVMAATRGTANAAVVKGLITEILLD